MVAAAAAKDAVERARRLPRLCIGLHLVLVDGTPALPPEKVPDLVDANGRMRLDLPRLGLEICTRPSVRAQVGSEIEAQFRAYAATGLVLDHVNAHKHFHLHPAVANEVIAIGARYGMRGLRVPYEPAAVLAEVERGAARGFDVVAPWAKLLAPDYGRRTASLAWPGRARCRLQGSMACFAICPPAPRRSIFIQRRATASWIVRQGIAMPTSSRR